MFNLTAALNTIKTLSNSVKSEYNTQLDTINKAKAQAQAEAKAKAEFLALVTNLKPQVILNDIYGLTNLIKNEEYEYIDLEFRGRKCRDLHYLSSWYNLATIIDDIRVLVNTFKDDIEEHMYSFDAYHEDYNECIIDFCKNLGVIVVPQHHEINHTICVRKHFYDYYNKKYVDDVVPTDIIDYIVSLIDILVSHSNSLYNDELCEGGYMFEQAFDELGLDFNTLGVDGEDDVDYQTFKNLVYYAGCIYSENGIC